MPKSRKASRSRQPAKVVLRTKGGKISAKGGYVARGGKLKKATKSDKLKAKRQRKPKAATSKKQRTLSTTVRERFSKTDRKFGLLYANEYERSGTLHARYRANLDPKKLSAFLDKNKGKSGALLLRFRDASGFPVYRTASSQLSNYFRADGDIAEEMLDSFYAMLNRYDTNKEIGIIDDVELSLFSKPTRFPAGTRKKARKHKRKK